MVVTEQSQQGIEQICECKVGRGIDAFGLSLDEELERRWTGDDREELSLRDLADFYNQRLLRAAMRSAGMDVLEGEVANTYRLLTDDDVSSGMQTQVRNRLESASIDVGDLESHFVSHQTIYTHLTDCLDVSKSSAPSSDADRREKELNRIRTLQNRSKVVTEDAIERLRKNETLSIAEFDVFVELSVMCRDCGSQYELGALFEHGGCECHL
jgi:hypothetical protein